MADRPPMADRAVRSIGRAFAGVRVRVTLAAVLAVACALAVSAAIVDATLQHDRHSVLMTTAQVQAREVVALNPTLGPPGGFRLPPSSNLQQGLLQVIHNGQVVASSKILRGAAPLWVPGDPLIQGGVDAAFGPAHDIHTVAVPVAIGNDQATVVVVVSLSQYDHSIGSVLRILEIGLPILLAVVGFICWWMVGLALRRIEALRREVADVATKPGERRVADPQTDDEVGRLARTLNSMLDRLEAASSRERRFVADASHELRSPIANIRTAVEVALHRPDTADWPDVAGEVLAQDGRMAHLVDELLLLARADEGQLIPVSGSCDLLDEVRSVVAAGARPNDPVTVSVEGTSTLVRVPGAYVERIVANLVDNAHRFASSRVDVTVGNEGGRALLRVRDDGPGIPPGARERVFERFVRLDEARDRGHGGFGLGLAITGDLCRAYGGTIEVDDAHPGAVFSVRLPLERVAETRHPVEPLVEDVLEPAPR
jgi:signal transduction histidine kinase